MKTAKIGERRHHSILNEVPVPAFGFVGEQTHGDEAPMSAMLRKVVERRCAQLAKLE